MATCWSAALDRETTHSQIYFVVLVVRWVSFAFVAPPPTDRQKRRLMCRCVRFASRKLTETDWGLSTHRPPPSPRTTRSWWLTTEHPNIIDGTSGVFTYFEESKLVGHRQRHGTSNRWSNGFAQLTGKVIKVRTPLSFLRRNKRKTTFSC